jgi:hypothetical protein
VVIAVDKPQPPGRQSRIGVVSADVIDDVINGLYAIGLQLMTILPTIDGLTSEHLQTLLGDVDTLMRKAQTSTVAAGAVPIELGLDQIIAEMRYVDTNVARLILQAHTTQLSAHLVDARQASQWALRALGSARRALQTAHRDLD